MIKRRSTILSILAILSVLWPLAAVAADQPFQRFIPLLVDLSGWNGKKPEGMSMVMSNAAMTTANRDYERGEAQLHATVVVGQGAEVTLAPIQAGVSIQTSEGHVISSTMRGMQVLKTYDKQQKSGSFIVSLGKDALFSLTYEGITEDDALALAEKFDWKTLQATAQTK